MALLDGPHLVSDALTAGLTIHDAIVAAEDADRIDIKPLVERLERQRVEVVRARRPVMAAVSPVRSSSPIVAIIARPHVSRHQPYDGAEPVVVVACDVQDPGNLGAIVRVAEAAGASGVVAAGQSADPFGWKALRGSMGSALRIPVAVQPSIDDAVAEAREHRCRVAATSPHHGSSVFDADLRGPLAILVGSEGAGLPRHILDTADIRVSVPMQSPVESLNAAVTAALVLYEARRQRR
jgi:TrmH family RNA methyltransferase